MNANQTLKVAMVIQGYHPKIGGAENQLKSLVPYLNKANCDVYVITRRSDGLCQYEQVEQAKVHRVRVRGPKSAASICFTLGALKCIRSIKPDVIHAHELLSPATVAVAAKRIWGFPVVAKVLGGGGAGDVAKLKRKAIGWRRIRAYSESVDAFITVSKEIDGELGSVGVPSGKRTYIPNGVDCERFHPVSPAMKRELRKRFGLNGGTVFIYTGRLATEKKIDQLLKIWPEIWKKSRDSRLLIVGTGVEEQNLSRLVGPGCAMVGAVEDVAPYLQASDVFVLPSEREGLSNSLLEAMASGMGVVSTDAGAARELIRNGVNGLVVPVGNAEAMTAALLQMMESSEVRADFGQRARESVVSNYSINATATRLRDLYDQLIQRKKDQ
jgi:glycosyltransferase involved in cell wall biosynthesis